MSKATFGDVVKVAQDVAKRGSELWTTMVLFTMGNLQKEFAAAKGEAKQGESLKAKFKEHEDNVAKATEVKVLAIGAYRSAKSVVMAAARYGVPIVDSKGKPIGKTEVEKLVADLRTPQTDVVTITKAFTTIESKIDKITDKGDMSIVFGLAKKAYDKIETKAKEVLTPKDLKVVEQKLAA